jgi:uncharacterized protein (TIGR03435 family)
MGRTAAACCIAGAAIIGTVASFAQSKPRIAFEVASVRMHQEFAPFRNLHRTTDARVDRIRSMGMLLMEAFRQPTFHRISAPDWVNEVTVEIQATMPPGATSQQVPEMLQTLLEERFGLVTRREARPMDAYELVVAPGGIGMKEVEPLNELEKEQHLGPTGVPQREVWARDTPHGFERSFQVPGGGYTKLTSRTLYERRTTAGSGAILTATRMSMAELVTELETNIGGPIVDRTGLGGVYQFSLTLGPDAAVTQVMQRAGIRDAALTAPVGVSTFKALEGIGLKLERRRVPVEMIVVDRILRTPTEN